MKTGNLTGKNLHLVSITRRELLDNGYTAFCNHCGTPICNEAEVIDEQGNTYIIGLDCKKTLIDKTIMDSFDLSDYEQKYKLKEYKKGLSAVSNFLKLAAYPNVKIDINTNETTITKLDEPNSIIPEIMGNIIFYENTQYLVKLGLEKLLRELKAKY